MTERKGAFAWFEIWRRIIIDKKEITKYDLAIESDCSLWTLKALSKDFCNSTQHIIYKNGRFVFWTPLIEQTLSTLSEFDKETLK